MLKRLQKSNAPIKVPVNGATLVWGTVVCVACFGLFLLAGGNVVLGLIPLILLGVVVALFSFPLKYTWLVFVTLLLTMSPPEAGAMVGYWVGPLTLLGKYLLWPLNRFTPVPIPAHVGEMGLLAFSLVVVVRTVLRNNIDGHLTRSSAKPIKITAFIVLFTVIGWLGYGIARGGDTFYIATQVRTLLFFPLGLIVSIRAFKDEKMYPLVAKSLLFICMIRVAEGAFFYFTIGVPTGIINQMGYIMTHDDSFMLVGAMALLLVVLSENPVAKNRRNLFIFGAVIMWAIVVNDRRVAFMSMALCMMLLYFFISPELRKKINRGLIYLSPIILIYIGVGMKSSSPIFAPVHTFVSVNDAEDDSNVARKIENMNLSHTISLSPILGTGFGFPYVEKIKAVQLGGFEGFEYLAHNQFLWLAYVFGVVGFFLIWTPLFVGVFLAFRVHKYAQTSNHRILALMVVCVVIIYQTQAYADLGAVNPKGLLMVSTCLGCISNLSKRLKAY